MTVWKGTRPDWTLEPQGEGARGHWLQDARGDYVAMVCRRQTRGEEDANAKAIAAVPQMVEALVNAATALRILAEVAEDVRMEGAVSIRERETEVREALKAAGVEL